MDRWEQFNAIVDNKDLNIKEKGLLLIIFRFINKNTGYANPSRPRIKELAKISDNRTLDNIFNSLVEKGFLVRETSAGRRTKYYLKVGGEITKKVGVKNVGGEITLGGEITPTLGGEITPGVGGEITPRKEKEKENVKEKIYIDFSTHFVEELEMINLVKVTNQELQGLLNKFTKSIVYRKIRELDEYLTNNPDKEYKNHYLTLFNWLDRDNATKVTEEDIAKKYM